MSLPKHIRQETLEGSFALPPPEDDILRRRQRLAQVANEYNSREDDYRRTKGVGKNTDPNHWDPKLVSTLVRAFTF